MVSPSITGFVSNIPDVIYDYIGHMTSTETIIFDIAIILIISTIFAFIARLLKQPLIPAYILTGLVLGPTVFGFVQNMELITAFSEIGIALLLFFAGIEISFKKIKEANLKKILFIGTFQVAIIFFLVFFLRDFLGLNTLQAGYFGMIMAFGSTMVDIKILSERRELVTLHGRLVLGILLLEDLIAIASIIFFTAGEFIFVPIAVAFAKLLGIIIFAVFLQRFVLDRIFKFAAKSTEILLLTSLGVLFIFIILSFLAELSIVIGAFIAGVSLANSPFKIELESRISSLRDFFAILFFVALGTQIIFKGLLANLLLLGVILIVAFIIKPIISFILLRIAGYRPKTSFFTAISLAHLSEFALIIGMLGVTLGAIEASLFSVIILGTIITMSVTPYLINYKEWFYKIFSYPLSVFKFLPIKENLEYGHEDDKEVILIGAHRMGSVLLKELLKKKEKLLVIDYNPEIINELINNKISCIYGDITSSEVLNKVSSKKLRKVISTVPNYEDNLLLLKVIKGISPHIKVIVTGSRISEANKLYEAGADYVITPKISAGHEVTNLIRLNNPDFKRAKIKHIKRLKEIHNLLY